MDDNNANSRAATNVTPGELADLQQEGRRSAEPRASSTVFPNAENFDAPRPSTGSDSYYPSWLPRRPARPVHPGHSREPSGGLGASGGNAGDLRSSNEESSNGRPSDVAGHDAAGTRRSKRRWAHKYGRKPTERAVRVMSLPAGHADPVGLAPRSRNVAFDGSSAPPSLTSSTATSHNNVFTRREYPELTGPRPRFRVPGLHLNLAEHPSSWNRLLFYLFPILVFAHVPIQAFLDFNAAYMLLQSVISPYQLTLYANPGAPRIAKHPTPSAPGAPVNGRNWAFAFAAYLTVYFIYFFGVFIGYANRPS